jgi:hypothetical protein
MLSPSTVFPRRCAHPALVLLALSDAQVAALSSRLQYPYHSHRQSAVNSASVKPVAPSGSKRGTVATAPAYRSRASLSGRSAPAADTPGSDASSFESSADEGRSLPGDATRAAERRVATMVRAPTRKRSAARKTSHPTSAASVGVDYA